MEPTTSPSPELLTFIANEYLGIDTLVPRNRDSLDFHSVSVRSLSAAFAAAYRAGATAAKQKR